MGSRVFVSVKCPVCKHKFKACYTAYEEGELDRSAMLKCPVCNTRFPIP